VLFSAFAALVFLWGLTIRTKVVPLNEDADFAGGH